jgi:hypothetical protein
VFWRGGAAIPLLYVSIRYTNAGIQERIIKGIGLKEDRSGRQPGNVYTKEFSEGNKKWVSRYNEVKFARMTVHYEGD